MFGLELYRRVQLNDEQICFVPPSSVFADQANFWRPIIAPCGEIDSWRELFWPDAIFHHVSSLYFYAMYLSLSKLTNMEYIAYNSQSLFDTNLDCKNVISIQ